MDYIGLFHENLSGTLLKNAREGLAREIVESLYDKGVGEIDIGYPKGIAQGKETKGIQTSGTILQ